MDIRHALVTTGIAPVDGETLMAFVLGKNRAYVLAHPEQLLDASAEKQWMGFIERRRAGEPIAYMIGQREFYGRTFHVDRRVHIPRPSTENLVTMALDFLKEPKDEVRELETGIVGVAQVLRDCSNVHTIVDVGTGSGCIAITLALERPELQSIAIDVSADALAVAKENAARLGAFRMEFFQGNLLSPLKQYRESFVLVSNPPYLSASRVDNNTELHAEPQSALMGGSDGNEIVEEIFSQAGIHPQCVGIVCECERPPTL